MVNYVGKFVPNLSSKTVALRHLLENSSDWQWNHEHAREWSDLKEILITAPVLKFFDPTKRTKVSTDASSQGLGAVLLQEHDSTESTESTWCPVAYASRAMTSAERRYAQIEKETLGVVYACEKFREYIYGRPTLIETDHKPLISISKKNLCDTPPRIQRLMLRLQNYDLTFEFTPGKFLVVADALSRAFVRADPDRTTARNEQEVEIHVNLIQATIPVSQQKWRKIAAETARDPVLQEVIGYVDNGWNVPAAKSCRPYYHFQEELSVVEGVLLKGVRIVVPVLMRPEMITRVHEGHLGIEKSRRRARTVMYWPNMNAEIERAVNNCAVCLKYRYKQQKEPLKPHHVPNTPWMKVGADLFHLQGKDYLVIVDYMSNYPEVDLLSGTKSLEVIKHIKSMFARHGIPEVMVTDNGPQFSCAEFKNFAAVYEFHHETSSPLYPQSNGQAEKAVQIVKRLVKKSVERQEDPYLALLAYRSSPLECGLSPAELLMGRKLNTRLPSAHHVLQPSTSNPVKRDQCRFYNRGAKRLSPLSPGDTIRMRAEGRWEHKARVLDEPTPRSYRVQTEFGQTYRRNRRDLLLTREHVAHQELEDECVSPGVTKAVPGDIDNTHRDGSTIPSQSVSPVPDQQPVDEYSSRGRVVKKPQRLIEEC